MRKSTFVICMSIMLAAFLTASCKNDDSSGPTQQELAFEKLSGQWTLGSTGSIMLDGQYASLNYLGFALSFANGTYTTTNAGNLFKANGTWQWANEVTINLISVDDGKQVNIQQLNENLFVFSFTQSDGGVRAGIEGNYVVTVVK